jgi:hypothetical protein
MRLSKAGRATGDIRSAIPSRAPGMRETIESARDPRHALSRLLPYLSPFRGC